MLAQPEFAASLLKTAKDNGLNTCCETTGFAKEEVFAEVIENLDTILFDVKHWDSQKHKEGTAVPNELILSMQETADARAVIKEGGSGIPGDETIERLKKLSGEQPYLYLQLASAYVRKGDAAAAREALQSYLSVRPLNTYVAAELSTAYLKEGKTAEAKEMIEKGLACEDGTYVELLEYNSLVAAEADGDYEASFAKAEELHQRYPENESITKEYTFLYTRTHPNTEPVNPNNDALEDNSGY